MNEYVTEGIVLHVWNRRETDRTADIFTRRLGRVDVQITGGRKPLSKLAPHIDVLRPVQLRLIEKNRVTVVDALADERFPGLIASRNIEARALSLVQLLRVLLPKAQPDEELWYYLVRAFRAGFWRTGDILRILGYSPEEAACAACGRRLAVAGPSAKTEPAGAFHLKGLEFFCRQCGSKVSQNEIIYLD